jgi:hypothetical protein
MEGLLLQRRRRDVHFETERNAHDTTCNSLGIFLLNGSSLHFPFFSFFILAGEVVADYLPFHH